MADAAAPLRLLRGQVLERGVARDSITRLVGAVLAEQHGEWAEGRRYLGLDLILRAGTKPPPLTRRKPCPSSS